MDNSNRDFSNKSPHPLFGRNATSSQWNESPFTASNPSLPPKELFSVQALTPTSAEVLQTGFSSQTISNFAAAVTSTSQSSFFQEMKSQSTASQPNIFASAKQDEKQFSFTTPTTPKTKFFSNFAIDYLVTSSSTTTTAAVSKQSLSKKVEASTSVAMSNIPSPPKGLFSSSKLASGAECLEHCCTSTEVFSSLFKSASSGLQKPVSVGGSKENAKRLFGSAVHASFQQSEHTRDAGLQRDQKLENLDKQLRKDAGQADQLKSSSGSNKRLIRKSKYDPLDVFVGGTEYAHKVARKDSSQSEQTGTPTIRRRRLSSSSTPQVDTVSIQCTKVPREYNDKENLRRHFSRFGEVVRVRPNQLRNSATIHFSSSKEAAAAKEKGKSYFGHVIHIYFYRARTTSTEKSPLQQKSSAAGSLKISPILKTQSRRTSAVTTSKSRSLLAKSNAEKLALLDKIDKILRSQIVKESDLSKAVVAVGTCPDMCPEKERYLRLQKNLLSSYEMGPNRAIDHNIVIKEYSRSSADQEEALSHELRPSNVLRVTMDYLLTHVMRAIDYEKTAEWYDFVWNRTRAIRKEISIQQLNDPLAIEVTEECARFHICCAHELCEMDVSNFDPKINNENLEKTMKTVLDMYEDVHLHHAVYQPPNEAEFQSYFILLNINRSSDVLRAVKKMDESVRYSVEVRLAVSAFSALQSYNFAKFFTVVDQASYLQAALLHRYFKQVRQQAIRIMAKAYTSKPQCSIPVEDIIRSLRFNDIAELENFCASYGISIGNGCVILLRAVEYTAESLSSFCSQSISRKMAGRNLGDVIANERHPSSEIPQPTSSFDENGYYIGPHFELLKAPSSALKTVTASAKKPASRLDIDPSLNEVHEALREKGISNDVVKVLAKNVFLEIIEEFVGTISEKELLSAHYHVMSDQVAIDVVNEDIESDLKKLVSDVILYEKIEAERKQQEAEEAERKLQDEIRRQKEKERKRLELERKMKELAECIERSSESVACDIENEVVSELTKKTAMAVYREKQFEYFTQIECDGVMRDAVFAMLKETVQDCVKTERKSLHFRLNQDLRTKRTAIRWTRWKKELEKVQLFRLSCQLFPCTSLSRNIHQQIKDLLPPDQKGKLVTGRKSDQLTFQPFQKLFEGHGQLRDDVTKRIPEIESIHYDVLPFNNIVYENIKEPNQNTIFWKVSLASPVSNNLSKWFLWMQHKFGFLSKQSANVENTVMHERVHEEVDDGDSVRSCVCCKMLSEKNRMHSDIFGTSCLVVLLTETDFANLNHLQDYVSDLLSCLRPFPCVPLLVLCCASTNIDEDSLSDFLQTFSVLSSHRIIQFGLDDDNFVLNCNKLTSGVEWLASESVTSPLLRTCRLKEFLEEQLSRHYISPLYRDLGLRTKRGMPNLDPYFIVKLYNKILDDLCSCLTDKSLLEVSWPAPEFCKPKWRGPVVFPHQDWNTMEEFGKLENLFEKLKLPKLPDLHVRDDIKGIEDDLTKYCYQVCPGQHHLALSVSRTVKTFADANELENGVNFFHQFPWQRLIDAIASSKFENVIYTESGDQVVVFSEESLEIIQLPSQFIDDTSKAEFQDLDDSEKVLLNPILDTTLHSLKSGARSNLKKILESSKESSNELKKFSTTVDWLETDDALEQSTNRSSMLKEEILNEIDSSKRFERDLERIIANGAEFL